MHQIGIDPALEFQRRNGGTIGMAHGFILLPYHMEDDRTIGRIKPMSVPAIVGGTDVDLHRPYPLHCAEADACMEEIRTRISIVNTRLKDGYRFAGGGG